MNRKYTIGAVVVVLLLIGAFFWYTSRTALAPGVSSPAGGEAPSTTPTTASTTSTPAKSTPFTLSLVKGDTVVSWNFQGAYSGNAELTLKAQVEIARLSAMLGSKQSTNYELYVSIANQYDLLGDGAKEFSYLEKALGIDSKHTGLAWDNMGQLLGRLGANLTARMAFEQAVTAQPAPQYIRDLLDFLKAHFPQDSAAIQKVQKLLQ